MKSPSVGKSKFKNSLGKDPEMGFSQVNNFVVSENPKVTFNQDMKRGKNIINNG